MSFDKYEIKLKVFNDCFITEMIVNGKKLNYDEAKKFWSLIFEDWNTTQIED